MKVKTNLTPNELDYIGNKLQELAKSQQGHSLTLENDAERELLRKASYLFDFMLESLQKEVSNILLDESS